MSGVEAYKRVSMYAEQWYHMSKERWRHFHADFFVLFMFFLFFYYLILKIRSEVCYFLSPIDTLKKESMLKCHFI